MIRSIRRLAVVFAVLFVAILGNLTYLQFVTCLLYTSDAADD